MEYDVNVIAACDSDIWSSETEKFVSTIKTLIDGLNVDYKFKIVTSGAQRSSWDSDNLLTISRHFTSGLKASFTVNALDVVNEFEKKLASACNKIDTYHRLKIRIRSKDFLQRELF